MTIKSITGEDLLKYLNNRMEHIRINTKAWILANEPEEREKVRRMIIGRKRELTHLMELIHTSQIKQESKRYAKEIFENKDTPMPNHDEDDIDGSEVD